MKRMKKLASLLLAMAMVLGMTITSFAAGGNYKLTIETVKGHTYKIYQLATGDVSKDGQKLSNIQVGANAKADTTVENIKALVGMAGADLGEAAEALVNTTGTPIATVEGGTDGGDKTATLAGGYYVILDSYTDPTATDPEDQTDSLSRVMVTLVQDTTMIPKDTTIAPDKKIIDDVDGDGQTEEVDTNEAAIGDIITYKLSGLIPDMQDFTTFKYVFVDTMSKGLTPNVEVGDEIGGKVGTNNAKFEVTAVSTNDDGISTVRVALLNAISYKDQKGATVQVNITATLNQNAVVVPLDNPNKLKIDYSNDSNATYDGDPDFKPGEPTGTTPEVTVTTYTTKLDITKTIKNTSDVLTGAEFKLESLDNLNVGYVTGQEYVEDVNGTWYKLIDGAYTETAPTPETMNAYAGETKYTLRDVAFPTTTPKVISTQAFVKNDGDNKGKVVFTGLGVGHYKLTEVTTPDGYNTMEEVEFEITWTKEAGFAVNVTKGMEEDGITVGNDAILHIGTTLSTIIPNFSGSLLPSTGGIGTTIFYVVGGILVIGAGILLVAKKRMSSK